MTEFPEVELIPIYLENLHRSMPKGALLPGSDNVFRAFRGTASAFA